MTEQERRSAGLPPEATAALITTALRRKQRGDMAGARALLRVLASQQPGEPHIWLALATVAETRAEQRQALERVIALDPQHPLAQRGLQRFQGAEDQPPDPGRAAAALAEPRAAEIREAAVLAPTALRPVEPRDVEAQARWPLYIIIAIALLAVAVFAGFLRLPQGSPAPDPTAIGGVQASPAPPAPTAAAGYPPPTAAGAAVGAPPDLAATIVPPTPTTPPATPTPIPSPTEQPALAPGAVIDQPPWRASLLRPEYALPLEGGIGALQPNGRFVLALVAVGNIGAAPARIPSDLFTLTDSQGRRTLAQPAASTLFLNTYGRGQRGDFSMEEQIPPGGGVYSVPLIFDVPPNAQQLTLHVGASPLGWRVSDVAASGAPVASPTAAP